MSLKSHQQGVTIIPLIISSNKTLLTMFCNKMAYPVYLTIGNIQKDICQKPSRCAQILVTYILITKFVGIPNKTGHCCAQANLFHTCMQYLLALISAVGKTGVEMMSRDGIWCYVHTCQDCIRIGKFLFLIYDGMLCFFLTLALALRLLYYFSFVTAWPVGFEVDSTHVFKGHS